ncbi:MAG: class I SAM-dependent methyltransferase [Puia sp.]|nr:class I SAM-dependent methyltransferase [Puia sp.]
MELPDSSILTNIQVPGFTSPGEILFEKKYILTRSLENRLYTDEELMRLPEVPASHTHYKEWQIRKRSCRRLLRYLASENRDLEILEIGCGNGWLSHRLAELPGTEVTGLDINFTELQQAARVFSGDPNLHFIHGDIRSGILGDRRFDRIVFAASIQYFPYLKKIIHFALSQLKHGGEIHIMDTHFYRPGEVSIAKRRTAAYYSSLGYPEMADFYFHHCSSDLRSFHQQQLYNPMGIRSRLLGARDPFPWIRIKK